MHGGTANAARSTPLPITSTCAAGLSARSRSAVPCETATSRRWLRTPIRSRTCSHWTIPIVGRPVQRGAAIDENGAKKSSTTRSAGSLRAADGRPAA